MQTYLTPHSYRQFAEPYGCGAYGSGTYQDGSECVSSAPNTGYAPTETKGVLNGDSILLAVVGGALILLAAVIMIVWSRKRRKN